jgi:hypothetical protein
MPFKANPSKKKTDTALPQNFLGKAKLSSHRMNFSTKYVEFTETRMIYLLQDELFSTFRGFWYSACTKVNLWRS